MNIERDRIAEGEAAADREADLLRRVDNAVARILADAEQDVAARRARLARWLEERAVMFAGISRDRPRKKTL